MTIWITIGAVALLLLICEVVIRWREGKMPKSDKGQGAFERQVLASLEDVRIRLHLIDHKLNHLLRHAHDTPPLPPVPEGGATATELKGLADTANATATKVEAVAKKSTELSKELT